MTGWKLCAERDSGKWWRGENQGNAIDERCKTGIEAQNGCNTMVGTARSLGGSVEREYSKNGICRWNF